MSSSSGCTSSLENRRRSPVIAARTIEIRDTIMLSHMRANFLLLIVSVALCNVLYPAVLWIIGQTLFRDKAEGSLVYDNSGTPIGSRLIAQPFSGEGYFQPRPSAASYNAAASGG